jgi:DNA polymerase-3 subunit delta
VNRSRGRDQDGFERIQQEVEQGQRRPFYLLHGEEEFEREEACAWLVERLAPAQARDFNLDAFRAEGLAVPTFLGVYSSYPVLADHRLVVLREADRLTAEASKSLELVTDHPAETTALVVVGGKVDLRRRFFRDLAAKGVASEFRVPYENQVTAWLERHARRQGLILDADAADLLRSCVGGHLRELAGEVTKLSLLAGEGRRITRKVVETGTGGSRLAGIFELTDALGRREGARALALTRQLLAQGEESPGVVAMILRHFRLLSRARELLDQRLPRQEMASKLGVSPHFLSSYLDQARAYPAAGLWSALSALLQADSRLKSMGRKQEALVLELLVARLTLPPAGRGKP